MPEQDLSDLEYATGYEKMYGVTDERESYLRLLQSQLRRFDTLPTAPNCDKELIERLESQCSILAERGFNPAKEDHILNAMKVDFVHTTARIEGKPADTELAVYLDEHFDDARMERIYPKFVHTG